MDAVAAADCIRDTFEENGGNVIDTAREQCMREECMGEGEVKDIKRRKENINMIGDGRVKAFLEATPSQHLTQGGAIIIS
jgi:hypothetical protein